MTNRPRVALLCDKPFSWDCLASVYTAFRLLPNIELSVLTTSQNVLNFLRAQSVQAEGYGNYARIETAIQSAHIVFAAHPNALQPFVVDEDRCKVVYIPYGMSISAATHAQKQQYNLWIHNRAWRIIVGSEYHKSMFDRFCDRGGMHVVALGNPKWDLVGDTLGSPRELRFLWNIHYSGDSEKKYSTWEDLGLQILSAFRDLPETTLVVRPHPAFFRYLKTRDQRQAVRDAITQIPNVVLDESPSPVAAMTSCAAMLSDGSSMIYDFAVTGKPLLYLRTAGCEKLHGHAFRLVRDLFMMGDRVEQVRNFVNDVRTESMTTTQERRSKARAYLRYNRREAVGSAVRDYVLANLGSA